METAASASFLGRRRGRDTGLMDDIPHGFCLQRDGGRQLILVMKGHVTVVGRKKWKVPQVEREGNVQAGGEQL